MILLDDERAYWGTVLDEWARHQRDAHRNDEHACCPTCLDLVRLLDDVAATVGR